MHRAHGVAGSTQCGMSRSACSSCSLFYTAARRRRRCALGLGRAGVLIAPTPSPPPPPPTSRSSVASMTSPPGDPAGLSSDDGFPHSADGYELLQPIGRGATAICFRAICKSNQQEVAIKIIDLENCPAEIEDIRVRCRGGIGVYQLCAKLHRACVRTGAFLGENERAQGSECSW